MGCLLRPALPSCAHALKRPDPSTAAGRIETAGYGPYLDDRRLEILLDNARRLAAGQPLRNVVDKASWF